MRFVVALVGTWLSGTALAQDVGSTVEVVADTPSVRFAGESIPGPLFNEGQQVRVVAVVGGQLRLVGGDRIGWVPPSAVRPLPVEDAGAPPETP